ncbi:MAG: hypothetical protein AW07_01742 [Candidatus Accumulibacter sp. SK-11]|nr:MAG: hypothetical protein AW07_01742 [Candidatus Accumulibacter sp. SK-11]
MRCLFGALNVDLGCALAGRHTQQRRAHQLGKLGLQVGTHRDVLVQGSGQAADYTTPAFAAGHRGAAMRFGGTALPPTMDEIPERTAAAQGKEESGYRRRRRAIRRTGRAARYRREPGIPGMAGGSVG